MNKATEQLTQYAVNHLGAEFDGEVLALRDSFGVLEFQVAGRGLTHAGVVIQTQQQLRDSLLRAPSINEDGLLSGTLVTALGIMNFNVKRYEASRVPLKQATRLQLVCERPVVYRGLRYEAMHLYAHERFNRLDYDGSYLRRPGERGWVNNCDIPPSIRGVLREVVAMAVDALVTPAAVHAASVVELQERIAQVRGQEETFRKQREALESQLNLLMPLAKGA